MKAAVAALVHTPGISEVKTTLAKACGTAVAESFYSLSVRCVEELLLSSDVIVPFWAVAETEGALDDRWRSFPVVHQGVGGLGDRMHRVYTGLLRFFPAVILVGVDAPQLTTTHLNDAIVQLDAGNDFVLGPAEDGGFYLLAGKKPIPRASFTAIQYKFGESLAQLEAELVSLGPTCRIEKQLEIDRPADLGILARCLQERPSRSVTQERMIVWLREQEALVQGQ